MPVPKRIIQTARSAYGIDRVSAKCQQSLKEMHGDFELLFFSASERREFIRSHGNGLIDLYDYYPSERARVELFSVLSVYVLGGFYLDVDVQMHSRLDPLLVQRLVLTEERQLEKPPLWMPEGHEGIKSPVRLGVYAFGGESNHWFFDKVLCEMASRAEWIAGNTMNGDVAEYLSGGDVFTFAQFTLQSRFGPADIVLSGGCGGRWNEFGDYGSHILANEQHLSTI